MFGLCLESRRHRVRLAVGRPYAVRVNSRPLAFWLAVGATGQANFIPLSAGAVKFSLKTCLENY